MSYSTVVSATAAPSARDLARRRDEPDPAGLEDLGLLGATARAAEHGPDAGHQLRRAERLGQVIVRAGVQAGDPVGLGRPGRQHDHRDLALPPHQSEHLEAVQPGHHHVEEQQVVPAVEGAGQAPAAVVHGLQANVTAGEKLLQQLAQFHVVIHEQNGHANLWRFSRLLGRSPRATRVRHRFVPTVRSRVSFTLSVWHAIFPHSTTTMSAKGVRS